jgi:beta-carotene hydroxylase
MTTTAPPRTVKEEMEAGRRLTDDFGMPTVLLAIGLYLLFGFGIWAPMTGHISYFWGAVINTVFIYALYTIVHEAIHGNISSRRKNLRWVDLVVGTAGCIPLWLFYFPHLKQHMVHHTKANTAEDPDIYAKGSFLGWIFLRAPRALIAYFSPINLYRDCKRYGVPRRQAIISYITYALQMAVLISLLVMGYWREVLVLWFIPWWIGQTVMLTLFTWTPHHDHSETGRYRDTRESIFPGSEVLLLGQGHHLIHHMMPGVQWYRYGAVFREIRPLLEQNGVRIEGFWPRPRSGRAS